MFSCPTTIVASFLGLVDTPRVVCSLPHFGTSEFSTALPCASDSNSLANIVGMYRQRHQEKPPLAIPRDCLQVTPDWTKYPSFLSFPS
ncbi:hypothetical protein DFH07DRAFT_106905 [Mycena maculata]|uniref:Uncharacterized protein n=1 Tax=Mycena maculata TaxID=230809 RepID=A0AAD7JYJ6_9AGAR|nr:hypothetical protein DFH07DRAFT_106905 [Mycena maculata]